MRRKLWLLDLFLLISVLIAGFVLKQRQSETTGREQALLKQAVARATCSRVARYASCESGDACDVYGCGTDEFVFQGSQSERDS